MSGLGLPFVTYFMRIWYISTIAIHNFSLSYRYYVMSKISLKRVSVVYDREHARVGLCKKNNQFTSWLCSLNEVVVIRHISRDFLIHSTFKVYLYIATVNIISSYHKTYSLLFVSQSYYILNPCTKWRFLLLP